MALRDVLRTRVPFDDTYSMSGHDMFRAEQMRDVEVVRRMTIEDKIAFWARGDAVCASAGRGGVLDYLEHLRVRCGGEIRDRCQPGQCEDGGVFPGSRS